MKTFRILAVLATVVIFATIATGTVTAQDATPAATQASTLLNPPNADCAPSAFLKTISAFKPANDKTKDLATIQSLQDKITAQLAACNGLSFKGTGSKAIGPFTLDSGTYQLHVVTAGFFIATLKVISGDCSIDGIMGASGIIFNLMSGQATDGADQTLDSTGCRALITLSNVSAPWTASITLLQ